MASRTKPVRLVKATELDELDMTGLADGLAREALEALTADLERGGTRTGVPYHTVTMRRDVASGPPADKRVGTASVTVTVRRGSRTIDDRG